MSDIFHEVEEEVRREHYEKLWKKYGNYVIAVASVLVLGVAGYQAWMRYDLSQRQALSDQYQAALQAAAAGDAVKAEQSFDTLAKNGKGGYATLAKFQLANAYVGQGKRDQAVANVDSQTANLAVAQENLGYTKVTAPFDGIVTARQVSLGEMVGATSPTVLATIIQLEPIYVNFNINEQELQRVMRTIQRLGITPEQLKKLPVEAGLQTETGYPHKGQLDYAAPSVSASTGTLTLRGIFPNERHPILPGFYLRVRVPAPEQTTSLLVPQTAVGSDQIGRYVLVVNKDNVVEQRKIEMGPLADDGMRIVESGLNPDDRVVVSGILRAVPGQKVDPQTEQIPAAAGGK